MQSSIDAESIEAFLKTSARPSTEMPRGQRELTIPARDGYPLAATLFTGTERDTPLVIISSATGVPRQFYARFAKSLVSRGFDVLTYDYRGIGGSRPRSLRRFRARMSDWGHEDFEGVLRYAKSRLGRETVRVVGHSVGGQLLGFAESNAMIERVACVASLLGDYRLWPRGEKLRMLATWYGLIPLANAVFGYVPGKLGIGEDLPAGIAREWRDWCVTEGYFFGGDGESRRPGFARESPRARRGRRGRSVRAARRGGRLGELVPERARHARAHRGSAARSLRLLPRLERGALGPRRGLPRLRLRRRGARRPPGPPCR
jgi:predicted alpha/beta hydrolase